MNFDGSVTIQAPIQKVWESLTDPNFVSQCAPGLESMTIIEPDKLFHVVVAMGFGSVKVKFDVDVEFVELQAPHLAKMNAHGKAPGSGVDVTSEMQLSPGPDGATVLDWDASVNVVGSIANMASRLMGGITKKMSAAFFECVRSKIEVKQEAQP